MPTLFSPVHSILKQPVDTPIQPRILVVGPFMHRQGHFAIFPSDLASGFSIGGADVTLLYPFEAAVPPVTSGKFQTICLEREKEQFNRLMTLSWRILNNRPIMLCLAWLIFQVRRNAFDLVYWTDFEPDNQQSSWPLGLAALLGLYRFRTAFTEHHNFNWSKHRWQRLFRLDRIRLRQIEMFVHSRKLLEWIRLNMKWRKKGHFTPWGLWPDPASDEERRIARSALGIPDDARVLLVFGMQAIRRKEIDTLAEAVRTLPLGKPFVIMFAGMRVKDEPHPFEHPALVKKTNLHVQYHESFIPDESVKSFFAAADAVWAYYGSFIGASGVLAQAIAFGRSPICSVAGESGELCRRYKIGLIPPTDNPDGLRVAISEFLSMSDTEQKSLEDATHKIAGEMAWPNICRQIMGIMLVTHENKSSITNPKIS